MVKISVIIPVYNVEKYLRDTLDSVLNQTMIADIEVIMIDDGSTDNSRYIVDEYAELYDNFYAHHKNNEGQAIARNLGLKFAKGEYVHFMDADDYIPPKAYENMYNFTNYNDFIVGNVLKFGEYNIWENILFKKAFTGFKDDVKLFTLNNFPHVLWDTITCNKLFKKEFLDKHNIRFINKNIYYEDLLFSLQTYVLADSIGFSRNIFYFWRLRKDKSSITQKQDDVRNFKNRIEILKIYESMMEQYNLDDNLKDVVYSKWLNHDLKTSLKKLRNYQGKYYDELLKGANDILSIIPSHVKEDLNIYLKILYKIVENNDINSLLAFAHLEEEFKQNPQMHLDINEEYLDDIELSCDFDSGEFETYITDVFNDEKNLYLEYCENLEFSPMDCPHKTEISLFTDNEIITLNAHNNRITIPLNLIKDKNHLKIKISYETEKFKKASLLKNYSRKLIRYVNYDIDVGIGMNNLLYLDVKNKTDNEVFIYDIIFDDNEFIFKCKSLKPVRSLILTNYVTFREVNFAPIYARNSNNFIFVIPYKELSNNIINKWELNCLDSFNSIKLGKKFKFKTNGHEIIFKNKRKKIYISSNCITPSNNDINEIISKNNELIKKNKELYKDNIKLNKNIGEFKSRKLIKMVDNIKNIF